MIHKTKIYHNQAFGNHLLTASLAPNSGTLYLVPLEVTGNFCLRTFHYKYTWTLTVPPVPPGLIGSFNFFCALYRMMQGTGGTTNTIFKITDGPQGTSNQTSAANATGTEYQPQATASPIVHLDPEGIYYIGLLLVDTSILPARASWIYKGAQLPSSADFVYYRANTTGLTALPATDTISTAQIGQVYADID